MSESLFTFYIYLCMQIHARRRGVPFDAKILCAYKLCALWFSYMKNNEKWYTHAESANN